jgi:ferritin-like metal-binding protein YciE
MSKSEQKVLQYLSEAHASELALVSTLQSQILIAPRGAYRRVLESHQRETRDHARRLERRMNELGRKGEPLRGVIGLAEGAIGQIIALSKMPLDLIRGNGGEERVLKDAKDACAAEALEIATYTALERLANAVDDATTAGLAASIRADEEKMLERVLHAIPRLADAVVAVEVEGEDSYELTDTGAADALREAGEGAKENVQKLESRAKRGARNARKVPGVARAEQQVKAAVVSEDSLPIADYDKLTANEIVDKLSGLSQVDLAKVESYERANRERSTILSKTGALRSEEPWPGYDELTVAEVRVVLGTRSLAGSSPCGGAQGHRTTPRADTTPIPTGPCHGRLRRARIRRSDSYRSSPRLPSTGA